jgi:hypothetical protein
MRLSFGILLLAVVGFGHSLHAQGLQFSQVLKISNVEDTVPAGKVWKVESYWQSQTYFDPNVELSTCGIVDRHHPFVVDDAYYFKFDGSPGTGTTSRWTSVGNEFPLWLPAGTRLRTVCPDDFLSVLEFEAGP